MSAVGQCVSSRVVCKCERTMLAVGQCVSGRAMYKQ